MELNIPVFTGLLIIYFVVDQLTKDKCMVSHIKWIMREDADSLVVTASSEKMSCLQVWELREKALPVHKSLGNSENPQFFNTVVSSVV